MINPDLILEIKELTKRVNLIWDKSDQETRDELTQELAKHGVVRVGKSWGYVLNGRTQLFN